MFINRISALVAAYAGVSAAASMAAVAVEQVGAVTPTRKLHPAYATHPRGKGKQAKPAKRSNRLHISRRTRRKHRRAA
ncbi:MAG: hypothetical protein KYX66_23440 [Blastomonas fulva]|uniref:hypothetical protein n=1 Tax=Blastomonas fulva TaxID=1550728 RepID=UPI0024E21D9B|nr:hypothetical protein [Blastomonas fulva]MDK2759678.1 hypothetical protein [Blastomonas fulva]